MPHAESFPRWIAAVLLSLLALNVFLSFLGRLLVDALGNGIGSVLTRVAATIAAG